MAAADEAGRTRHDAWCRTVGPPVALAADAAGTPPAPFDHLIVVSWNVHAGAADVEGLVRDLRAGVFTAGRPVPRFVLLLQEAHRQGAEVPAQVSPGVGIPSAAGLGPTTHVRTDVVAVARALGLSLYYVPSMRNGPPGRTSEDRGNAILSTEPLTGFGAIELPFERQRRVAVVAAVHGRHPDGEPWTLRLASVHLESTASARRLRVFATGPRVRQARGLLEALGTGTPIVVGGDFNTWFGFADPTYQAMTEAWPDASRDDRRRTFGRFFRLDHVFASPPAGWQVRARRLDVRLGSDHYPLLAEVRRSAVSLQD
jgi:endonuclease/exonuclease/phosphatase family metal-dependent hydrolase